MIAFPPGLMVYVSDSESDGGIFPTVDSSSSESSSYADTLANSFGLDKNVN
jgi:hypothetical protein